MSTTHLRRSRVDHSPSERKDLTVDGDAVIGSPTGILTAVQEALEAHNPDVLVCSTSEIVPTLHEMATDAGGAYLLLQPTFSAGLLPLGQGLSLS